MREGDIYDIGQTVNGVSRFLYLGDKWYYVVLNEASENLQKNKIIKYNYNYGELTNLILVEIPLGLGYTKLIGNIFDDGELINSLDYSKCPEVLAIIRDNKLNELL